MIFADNHRKIPLIEVLPEHLTLLANWAQDLERRILVKRKSEPPERTGQAWSTHYICYLLSRLTGQGEARCREVIEPLFTEPVDGVKR